MGGAGAAPEPTARFAAPGRRPLAAGLAPDAELGEPRGHVWRELPCVLGGDATEHLERALGLAGVREAARGIAERAGRGPESPPSAPAARYASAAPAASPRLSSPPASWCARAPRARCRAARLRAAARQAASAPSRSPLGLEQIPGLEPRGDRRGACSRSCSAASRKRASRTPGASAAAASAFAGSGTSSEPAASRPSRARYSASISRDLGRGVRLALCARRARKPPMPAASASTAAVTDEHLDGVLAQPSARARSKTDSISWSVSVACVESGFATIPPTATGGALYRSRRARAGSQRSRSAALGPLPEAQAHRHAGQVEALAQPVLEEAAVGRLHRAGLGAEQHEGRRARGGLCGVEELHRALARRRAAPSRARAAARPPGASG